MTLGCNIVDIGASDGEMAGLDIYLFSSLFSTGDSTLNLAVASEGGTVVAFEMVKILNIKNIKY